MPPVYVNSFTSAYNVNEIESDVGCFFNDSANCTSKLSFFCSRASAFGIGKKDVIITIYGMLRTCYKIQAGLLHSQVDSTLDRRESGLTFSHVCLILDWHMVVLSKSLAFMAFLASRNVLWLHATTTAKFSLPEFMST